MLTIRHRAGAASPATSRPRSRRAPAHRAAGMPIAAHTPIAFQYPNGACSRPDVFMDANVDGNTLASSDQPHRAVIAIATAPSSAVQRRGASCTRQTAPANADR